MTVRRDHYSDEVRVDDAGSSLRLVWPGTNKRIHHLFLAYVFVLLKKNNTVNGFPVMTLFFART